MKYLTNALCFSFILLISTTLCSCLKNNLVHTKTYTLERSVFKTAKEIKADLKSGKPREIKSPGKILLFGNYIFLNEMYKGFHIIDNTNPSSPKNISFVDVPGNLDLAIKDNTLYADLYSDLIAFNISDLLNIKVSKIVGNVFGNRTYSVSGDNNKVLYDIIYHDTTITYNGELDSNSLYGRGLGILYVGQYSSSNSVTKSNSIAGSMATFALAGNYLYTVSPYGMNIFNITSGDDPVLNNKLNLGLNIETIFPFKDKLFLGSPNGMYIFDIGGNPAMPVSIGSFAHARSCDPVISDEKFAYVTLHSGTRCSGFTNQLDIVQLNSFTDAQRVISYPFTSPQGLAKDENNLFICDGKDGLKIYDASGVPTLKLLKSIPGFEPSDVILNNHIALVMAKDGVYQFSYSDLNNIHLLSKIQVLN